MGENNQPQQLCQRHSTPIRIGVRSDYRLLLRDRNVAAVDYFFFTFDN